MNWFAGFLLLSLLVETLATGKLFIPGPLPSLQEGTVEIAGYFVNSNHAPMFLPANSGQLRPDKGPIIDAEARQKNTVADMKATEDPESRVIAYGTDNDPDNQLTIPLPAYPSFSPFRITERVSVTRIVPPLCVACKCLQAGQTCLAAGGVQLFSTTLTAGAAGIAAAEIVAFGAAGATACAILLNGVPITFPNAVIPANTVVTLSCILPPPATLSACDTSCRSNTGTGLTACSTAPTSGNCPTLAQSAVCGTDCQYLSIGATVRCNSGFPTVISPRPSTVCNYLHKREADESDYAPELESSMETESSSSRGARLFQVFRTTSTRTTTARGSVTATYVGNNCLPRNIIDAPDC